jgi:hypothetical protein
VPTRSSRTNEPTGSNTLALSDESDMRLSARS